MAIFNVSLPEGIIGFSGCGLCRICFGSTALAKRCWPRSKEPPQSRPKGQQGTCLRAQVRKRDRNDETVAAKCAANIMRNNDDNPRESMVLEYLPTNWDYLENYINGVNVGKYSSTMDSLGISIEW